MKSEISFDWILGGSLSDIPAYDENSLAGLQAEQLTESEIVLTVYPTPATDFINIETTPVDTGRLVLKIFNNSGILVINQVIAVEPVLKVSISDLPPGIYYLKAFMQNDEQLFRSEKIVKIQTRQL